MWERRARKLATSAIPKGKGTLLSRETVSPRVHNIDYAVRGELVKKAYKMRRELEKKDGPARMDYPFDSIVECNIGNPQALSQKPVSFNRQMLSILIRGVTAEEVDSLQGYPEYIKVKAKEYLEELPPLGAYGPGQGLDFVRSKISKYIERRDGYKSSIDAIFCTDGASQAVTFMLQALLRGDSHDQTDGILAPIPQYPLYSAVTSLYNGAFVPYYLDHTKNWTCTLQELQTALEVGRMRDVCVRALVVINPGNPTGQILDKDTMIDMVEFCAREGLILMADEVYQENVYSEEKRFISFKEVACERGYGCDIIGLEHSRTNRLQLVSIHSTSKGFFGECGFRGGYMELMGFDQDVIDDVEKLASISLCSNIPGQVMTGLMVDPPGENDPGYETYIQEKGEILSSLRRRGEKIYETLDGLDGVTVNPIEGAMYAYPQIEMPSSAISEASSRGVTADYLYCSELLDSTGIIVVPGSGFGQKRGDHHYRITILPPESSLSTTMSRLVNFHESFMSRYK